MARPQGKFHPDTEKIITSALKEVETTSEMKRVQCILFRVKYSHSAEVIGEMVGYSEAHVYYVWQKYKQEGINGIIGEKRGGRYNENMTYEQEKELLDSFGSKAKKGGVIIISDIQKKYEERVGKKVNTSVIYRFLDRHDWRKIVPRGSHPKTNLEAQQKFKDGFPPRD